MLRAHCRVAAALAISGVVLSLAFGGLAGAAPKGGDARVTGPLTGQAPYTFGAPCLFARQQYVATIDAPAGPAALHVDGCAEQGASGFVFTGTYTIESEKGSLSGAATGTIEVSAPRSHVALDLSVQSATRALHAVRHDHLHLDAVWITDGAGGSTIEGTLSASR